MFLWYTIVGRGPPVRNRWVWAIFKITFQLLAVATPTVLFHFYSLSVAGEIQKMKEEVQTRQKVNDAQSEYTVGPPGSYDVSL